MIEIINVFLCAFCVLRGKMFLKLLTAAKTQHQTNSHIPSAEPASHPHQNKNTADFFKLQQ